MIVSHGLLINKLRCLLFGMKRSICPIYENSYRHNP